MTSSAVLNENNNDTNCQPKARGKKLSCIYRPSYSPYSFHFILTYSALIIVCTAD